MASIYLMRHGQASFASDDYDQLSALGIEQARFNGRLLAQQGRVPSRVIHGDLRRQQQSVEALLEGFAQAGCKELPSTTTVSAWNEFDHTDVIAMHAKEAGDLRQLVVQSDDKEATFASYFVAAMRRWVEGHPEAEYKESFNAFHQRVDNELQRLSQSLGARERVLVVTSGGPISMVAKRLLNMDVETALALNWRLVNGGLSKVAVSAPVATADSAAPEVRLQLISLNEHLHFSGPHAHLLTAR
ncbi:MAG: histidine phosphatase family protein [Idiomarina sp.]|nr:histidine phosphatase family protein [Idiomarina sp.]